MLARHGSFLVESLVLHATVVVFFVFVLPLLFEMVVEVPEDDGRSLSFLAEEELAADVLAGAGNYP